MPMGLPTGMVIGLSEFYSGMLVCEKSSSFKMDASPPNLCTNSAHISNDSGSLTRERNEP